MEWVLLLLLVPAIVLPVVLLWGFAGCEFEPQGADPILAPADLQVTRVRSTSVTLRWSDPNPSPSAYKVERTIDGGDSIELDAATTTFVDVDLEEGTAYMYRVRVADDAAPFSASVAVTTTSFQLAFTTTLTISQANLEGFCLIQRLEPLRLVNSGNEVRMTVRGSALADLTIDRIFISQAAAAGDRYDAAPDLTEVASGIEIQADTNVELPVIEYALDRTRPLLIAFDINPTPGQGNVIRLQPVPGTEAAMFFRAATAEAGVTNRLPSPANPGAVYSPSDSIYIVERIEVA